MHKNSEQIFIGIIFFIYFVEKKNMEFKTDEGTYFLIEDFIQFVNWKVDQLIEEGLTNDEITNWDESYLWKLYASKRCKYNNMKIT